MKSILHKVVYVLCVYSKFKLMTLCSKEKWITQKLIISLWVLALVLETFYKYPLYSLYCTNQPQTIELPFKEKKEKAWHFVPNFLVDQITYIETCNPNEWIIYQSLGLVVQIGRITHWAIITFFPLLDLMPCKLLSTGTSFIALSFFFIVLYR